MNPIKERFDKLLTWFEWKFTPEKIFLLIGIPFGFTWLLIVPPTHIPDEQNHFKRAYQISEGTFFPERLENYTVEDIEPVLYKNHSEIPKILVGGYLPKDLHRVIDFSNTYYTNEKKIKYKKNYYEDFLGKKINKDERVFYYFTNTALYSAISYLPQSLFIFTANQIFNSSALTIFFIGRLGGFIFWILCAHYSIKTTPIYKWVLLTVALFPMTIYENMSNCADLVSISCSFIFFSAITSSFQNGITKIKLIQIFVLSIFLSLGKYIYFGLIPIFILNILSSKSNRKELSLFLLAILLLNLFLIATLGNFLKPYYIPITPNVNPSLQLSYVLENPLNFLKLFFLRFPADWFMLTEGAIGILGWMDLFLSYKVYIFYIIAIIFVVKKDGGSLDLPKIKSFLLPCIIFCIVIGFYLIQYLSWNPYQNNNIEGGEQGRYFIPILPFFFLTFYKKKNGLSKLLKFSLAVGIILSLTSATLYILKEFYIK